jgi:hypothetical protein
MRAILQLLGGAASCAVFIALARRLKPERELRLYAVALVIAALIYLAFAARGTASLAWLALETGGLLVFTLAALAGLKFSAWILAAAWAAHAGWDLLLHGLADAAFVPGWYPPVCAGFDLLLAGYILARFGRNVSPVTP